jgi:DNA-binding transcriptional LysR family regulator
LADDVRHGRLDVALVGLKQSDVIGLEARELATVPYVVLMPSTHRLAERSAVRLEELAGERFIDMLPGFGNRTSVDRAFDAVGHPRRVRVEVPDLTTVPEYVRAGLGVAVVPEIDQDAQVGITRMPLAGSDLAWTLSAITLSGRRPSRAVGALLDLMADSVRPAGTRFQEFRSGDRC